MLNFMKRRAQALYLISLNIIVLFSYDSQALTKHDTVKYINQGTQVYNPLDHIVWTKVKDYGGVLDIGSPHYLDVISHTDPNDPYCPRSNGMISSQASIRIHETEHMLHYQLLGLVNNYQT